jgi:plasmid stabilization system protein ParE
MVALQWTAEGRNDVDDVYDVVGRRELQSSMADEAVRDLVEACESIADRAEPGTVLGTARPDFGDEVRLFFHQRWVIIFRPIKNGIEVLRVLDISQRFSHVFGD